MKKVILICGLIFFFANAGFSQTVNGVKLKDFKSEYLQVNERLIKARGTKIHLLVNFGQPIDLIGNMEKLLLDSIGNRMVFNSIIDSLNFMHENGYELVQPYKTELDQPYKIGSTYFLMRKMKND